MAQPIAPGRAGAALPARREQRACGVDAGARGPGIGPAFLSMMRGCMPRRASSIAATNPTGPAPTMRMSSCSAMPPPVSRPRRQQWKRNRVGKDASLRNFTVPMPEAVLRAPNKTRDSRLI